MSQRQINVVFVKKLGLLIMTLILFSSSLPFNSINLARATEIPDNWVLEGDTVYIDDNNVRISVNPAYSSGGWVYLNFTSKNFSGDIDLAFGFDREGVKPTEFNIQNKKELELRVPDYYFNNPLFKYNISDNILFLWTIYGGVDENNEEITLDDWFLTSYHNYDRASLQERKIYWSIDYWREINKDNFNKIEYQYGGMDSWYYSTFNIQQNVEYKARFWLDTPIQLDGLIGKYWVAIKPSSESIGEAISKDHFYSLDPWFNTSWLIRKTHEINQTVGAGTNYQVGIKTYFGTGTDGTETVNGITMGKVYLDSKAETDFSDVRFTDNDEETQLDYFLQEKVNSNYAIFWVEVADDLDAGNVTIYIYYDSSGAVSTSSGSNTFVDFDDFEDDDFSEWTMFGTITSSATQAFTGSKSAEFGANSNALNQTVTYTANAAHLWIYDSSGQNDAGNILLIKDENGAFQWVGEDDITSQANYTYEKDGDLLGATVSNVAQASGWNPLELRFSSGGVSGLALGNTVFSGATGAESRNLSMGNFWNLLDDGGNFDTFFVRKYNSPEPIHGVWGVEEGFPSAPTLDDPDNAVNILVDSTVIFNWTFNPGLVGDNQSAFRIQIFNTSDNSIWNDSTKTTSSNENYTVIMSEIVNLKWRVRTWDDEDDIGPYSSNFTLSVNTVFTDSVTITNIEAGNWIFAANEYLFEAVYGGGNDTFKVAFDDGVTFINMSYDRPDLNWKLDSGSSVANLLSVTFSESSGIQTVIFRLFINDAISDALDRDIHMWVNDTNGNSDGWNEERTDYVNVYNQGGLTESTFTGGAGLVAGGHIFGIAVQNSTDGDYGRVNVTWRKFQQLSFKVSVFQANSWDAGNNHWECISEHTDTAEVTYGVDYFIDDGWVEGWKVTIFVDEGKAGNAGNDNAWAKLNVTWYNREASVASEFLYVFYEAHNVDDGNTQFSIWVDLWVDKHGASSRVGGRVNPVFFGMKEQGWGPWASWAPLPNASSVSLYGDDLLDSSNAVITAGEIDLFKVWASFNKTAAGAATPTCDGHQWALIDYDIFDWRILSARNVMIGVDTPVPNVPRTPDIGAPGLFSSLITAISLMGKNIVNAIVGGATSTAFAFSQLIDSSFSFFGIDNFVGLMTSMLQTLATRFTDSINNVTLLVVQVFNFISRAGGWFIGALTNFVSFWVLLSDTVFAVTQGTYGGFDWWTLLEFSTWGPQFLPIVFTLYWFMTVDDRAKQQGGNWINILWGDANILLGMTSFLMDMFFTLINFTISSIFNIMNALDIVINRLIT